LNDVAQSVLLLGVGGTGLGALLFFVDLAPQSGTRIGGTAITVRGAVGVVATAIVAVLAYRTATAIADDLPYALVGDPDVVAMVTDIAKNVVVLGAVLVAAAWAGPFVEQVLGMLGAGLGQWAPLVFVAAVVPPTGTLVWQLVTDRDTLTTAFETD
jgi:hypothetical protein